MRILVSGVGSELGAQIALRLRADGHEVLAARRKAGPIDTQLEAAGCGLVTLDLADIDSVRALAPELDAAVLTPILTISATAAQVLAEAGVERGVVFSSNNVAVVPDDPVYAALAEGEADVVQAAPGWAVLRPTMIYGYPGDGNLSRLLAAFARWPILPVPGPVDALQQPVHVEDLARIAAALVTGGWPASGRVAVGGPDMVSHRELVGLARQAVNGQVLPVPPALARIGAALLRPAGIGRPQIDRLTLDKQAVDPAEIPPNVAPRIGLAEGLADLARQMGLTPPDR